MAWGLPALLLSALTLLYFWPQLVGGKALFWGDIGLYFTPMQTFLHLNLRAGRLPLWNPLLMCGTPYVGNPQTWPLYPFTALLPFLSAPQFLNWTIAFHVWLAGMGAFALFRRTLPVRIPAALLGAIVFMFGGQLVSKEQFPNMVQAAAYLPLVLLLLWRLFQTWRGADALWLGLALGLQLLAAHAQMTLLTLYLALAWSVFLWRRQSPKIRLSHVGKRLALAGLIAAGLAAGQLFPALDLFVHAARQNLRFGAVNRFYLPMSEVSNLILPTLRGHPFWGNFSGRGNFWETCCYVGLLPFVLALVGGLTAWRRGGTSVARFWTGVCAFGLWMALGGNGGVYWLAYYVLPGFRNFHDPVRCLLWATFALSALAACGCERVLKTLIPRPSPSLVRSSLGRREPEGAASSAPPSSPSPALGRGSLGTSGVRVLPTLLLLLTFFDLAHFGRTIYPLADRAALFPTPPAVAAAQADPAMRQNQARFLAPDTKRVWQQFTGWRTYRQNAPGFHALWADSMASNLMMAYGLRDAYGYEPVALDNAKIVTNAASLAFGPEAEPAEKQRATALAGCLSVGDLATYRIVPPEMSLPGLVPIRSDQTLQPGLRGRQTQVYLSRNLLWQPRARVTTEFIAYPTPEEARAAMGLEKHESGEVRLSAPGVDLSRTTVVVGAVPFASVPGGVSEAAISEDGPDRVVVQAATTAPALLVLADTDASGWRATVDGKPAPILSADGSLRAVTLAQPGAHTVKFIYRPFAFQFGLYLTLLTAGFLAGAAAFGGAQKTRRKDSRARLSNSAI